MFVVCGRGTGGFLVCQESFIDIFGRNCNMWMFMGATPGHWRRTAVHLVCVHVVFFWSPLCPKLSAFCRGGEFQWGTPWWFCVCVPLGQVTYVSLPHQHGQLCQKGWACPCDPGLCLVAALALRVIAVMRTAQLDAQTGFVSWCWLKGLLYSRAAGIWSQVKEPNPATPNICVDIYRAVSKLPQRCRSLCRGKQI